ncbi:MAG: type IV pilus assembly protein PilN [Psychromonas sp.]|jgi:type IV pilus assembly protein PilN
MSNINLLPWRDDLKKKKKRMFLFFLGLSSILILGVSYSGTLYVDDLIGAQNQRNEYLQIQNTILDRRIVDVRQIKKEKKELERRILLIQKLEEKRNYATHLFNILPQVVPTGIYLNSISFVNGQVDVRGMSESNNRLTKMTRNIDSSDWLGDAYISSIITGPIEPIKLSQFVMRFVVIPEQKGGE